MKKAFQISVFTLLIVSAMFSSCKKTTSKPDDKPFGPKTWLDGNWKLVKTISTNMDGTRTDTITTGCLFDIIYNYNQGTYSYTETCAPKRTETYHYELVGSVIKYYALAQNRYDFTQAVRSRTDSTFVIGNDGGGGGATSYSAFYKRQK